MTETSTTTAQDQIRTAYATIAADGQWIGLAQIRAQLPTVARADLDAALEQIACTEGVHITAEPNQKSLTTEDRAAAVYFGGDERHMMKIEAEWED